jgi:sec-independent protein translocase protein TatA
MPTIGPLEIAIVLLIALVFFGPKRLPELGRSVGRGIKEFKGSITDDEDATKTRAEVTSSDGADQAPAEGRS